MKAATPITGVPADCAVETTPRASRSSIGGGGGLPLPLAFALAVSSRLRMASAESARPSATRPCARPSSLAMESLAAVVSLAALGAGLAEAASRRKASRVSWVRRREVEVIRPMILA